MEYVFSRFISTKYFWIHKYQVFLNTFLNIKVLGQMLHIIIPSTHDLC